MGTVYRTHYAKLTGEQAGHAEPLCGQKRKLLLELLVTQDWARVTCTRCLTHKPKAQRHWLRDASPEQLVAGIAAVFVLLWLAGWITWWVRS